MGSGFRVWTAGEVVSASNVNNYLQEQTVMSFAGTAARSSAIASPEEGMLSYLQDSDTYQGYDGSAWVNLGTLSGASDSGLIHIVQTTWSGVASVSVDNCFTSTYRNYRIVGTITAPTGNATINMRLRAAASDFSSANYNNNFYTFGSSTGNGASGGQTSLVQILEVYSTVSDESYAINMDIFKPQLTAKTNTLSHCVGVNTAAADFSRVHGGLVTNTFAADGFTWFASTGNFSGTLSVYGYKD